MAYHKQHFSQASHTPFAQPDVIQRFGLAADTKYAQAFRTGDRTEFSYCKDSYDQNVLVCVQPTPSNPPLIDINIELNHVKTGLKVYSEKTTTSPVGRVLPLYKIWIKKPHPDDDCLTSDDFFKLSLT